MFEKTYLKTRLVSVLNGPIVPSPEANREAEKATCLTERKERESFYCTYLGMSLFKTEFNNLDLCLPSASLLRASTWFSVTFDLAFTEISSTACTVKKVTSLHI